MSILNTLKLNSRLQFKQLLPAQPCVLCGTMSHEGLWCAACNREMPYFDAPHCPVCGLITPTASLCGRCLTKPPAFARTTTAFYYRFPIDRLIQSLKYHSQLALAPTLAKKLLDQIDEIPDLVIPMPLHPAKLKERGFNQASLIATPIANTLRIDMNDDACHRLRNTPSQTALPWNERESNVRDAFDCTLDLSEKHIALVDDVMTTGASMNELARAVQKRGAKKISIWIVARATTNFY
ncbi:MAG TPA: phosphoribosyltransferase [Gallionella sp.]|nr:MAG: phosphoribosyltransferase [Gallionellales bacterium GWA2_54_124]OGT18645.1 MAG: phosphoribosyltransferase [Gallionellales bacterium RIFOXYD12_FULL_53_10]OGT25015.1 MAG: phosphoribosyltransferase [Gallionellales bacterium RIFOXYD2_FULL_52_7]HCI52614.1 phosphoribosyltransferase [Gallionella sp.]